ncbi:MAG: TipAS antibiotic-recognition domain-containing protein [Rhizonema sp. NSF051]|nr:TipAS antibiotic-recognition domain-containing protein [Rhizonema sp. NSF051]
MRFSVKSYLKERRQLLGEERIRLRLAEWQELIGQARVEMENGSALEGESVQALARRWLELIQEFTGDDAGIERSRVNKVSAGGI